MNNKAFEPLDEEERELMEESERGEWKSNPEILKHYKEKASERISIRVEKKDIEYYKHRAEETGIPYQTIISSLIHRGANGGIEIKNPV